LYDLLPIVNLIFCPRPSFEAKFGIRFQATRGWQKEKRTKELKFRGYGDIKRQRDKWRVFSEVSQDWRMLRPYLFKSETMHASPTSSFILHSSTFPFPFSLHRSSSSFLFRRRMEEGKKGEAVMEDLEDVVNERENETNDAEEYVI
jgi:hypothetical protein